MTRILVLFGNIPLFGKERGNIQALRVLHEAGADVLFATNKEWGHDAIEPALDAAGLPWVPMTVARPLRRTMSVRDVLKVGRDIAQGWRDLNRIIREYEPTHIHIPNQRQTVHNLPVLRAAGVPIVYRLGDDPVSPSWLRNFQFRHLVAPTVTKFVGNSEFIRRRAIGNGVDEDDIRVIYSFPPERTALPESPSPVDDFDGRTVVYMGQLSEEKGVDLLVEAALRICSERGDVRFMIAGNYTWENPFAQSLLEKVAQHGLENRICFLGYVENVPELLAGGDVHTCPSVCNEALSNGVLEAKMAGVPTVIFPSGGLPEMICHGVDGYTCPAKTAEALEAGLRYFLDLDEGKLDEAKREARTSLGRLGITKTDFTRAWLDVYGATSTTHASASGSAGSAVHASNPSEEPHSIDA